MTPAAPATEGVEARPALGVERLEAIWERAIALREGRSLPNAPSDVAVDKAVFDLLGVGREAANRFLLVNGPSLAEFERWVAEANGGSVAPWRIARAREIAGDAPRDAEAQRRIDALAGAAPVLDAGDLGFFDEHGYLVLDDAVPADLCAELAEAIPEQLAGRTQGIMVQLFDHPAQRAIRDLPRIHKAFAQLWGTADLIATTDRCGFNPPLRDGQAFPGPDLHLDVDSLEPPIPFDLGGIVYLTDTPAEQGAFQCVPGHHRRVLAEPPPTRDMSHLEGRPIPGRAGDMVIWHGAIPHGATPNRGERPRIVQYLSMYSPQLIETEESQ